MSCENCHCDYYRSFSSKEKHDEHCLCVEEVKEAIELLKSVAGTILTNVELNDAGCQLPHPQGVGFSCRIALKSGFNCVKFLNQRGRHIDILPANA